MTASLVSRLRRVPARILSAFVRLYQVTLSPILPASCRFYPSCSQYALEALQKKPLLTAVRMILWRLLRCQPFCKGGYDPVEPDTDPTPPVTSPGERV
ncbi:membrane protein insertion efficiency factor YidD [candidate division BRC1 bacterium HGW-BRC1-1]|nr:MAG: membrane protein insertion efficiency factor YidD [candidate division BRC1 bacterium HGW-BRC1-1]